jgi:hypothetical protein
VVELAVQDWLWIAGMGALWLGVQIIWVAPLPRQLRQDRGAAAVKGSARAFGLFWLDQYGYIGLSLTAAGALLLGAVWLA